MVKVSVVMPCLNEAKYIDECMSSVLGQTLKEMEIILVDAGSTDGTLEILEGYSATDSRIKLLHSGKKSYGYQMNMGIAEASGEYIGIVETDDVIRADMMETLYQAVRQEKADYVKGTARGFYPQESGIEWEFSVIPCEKLKVQEKVVLNPSEHPILFDSDNFLWNGIYRADFLKKIQFHETPGAAFQDISALFRIISRAQKAVYINHLVYDYRQNNLKASSYNRKSFQYTADEYEYIQNFLDGLSEEWVRRYYLKMVELSYDRMFLMASTGEYWEEADAGIELLQKMIADGILNGKVTWECYDGLYAEFGKRFLINPRELYDEYVAQFVETNRVLRHLLITLKDKKFYIFGSGVFGRFLHMYFVINGILGMQGYCDNNPDMHGTVVQNQLVYNPTTIESIGKKYFVVAMKKNSDEIKEQLLTLGVPEKNIECYGECASRLLFVNRSF